MRTLSVNQSPLSAFRSSANTGGWGIVRGVQGSFILSGKGSFVRRRTRNVVICSQKRQFQYCVRRAGKKESGQAKEGHGTGCYMTRLLSLERASASTTSVPRILTNWTTTTGRPSPLSSVVEGCLRTSTEACPMTTSRFAPQPRPTHRVAKMTSHLPEWHGQA